MTGIRQHIVKPVQRGSTLQAFIADELDLSRRKSKDLIDARAVFVNGRAVWMARHALTQGDRVEIRESASLLSTADAVRVLHRGEGFLIVDKPCGLLSTGRDSLELALRNATGERDLRAVHRLDRDTSGCLLVALGKPSFDRLVELFAKNTVRKTYHAIALGALARPVMTIRKPIDGQRAVTHIHVLETGTEASYLRVRIETGRTHQIRKHLAGIGHPVAGDRQYGPSVGISRRLATVARQMLHSRLIEFRDPVRGEDIRVEAPLPSDFRACLKSLGLHGR